MPNSDSVKFSLFLKIAFALYALHTQHVIVLLLWIYYTKWHKKSIRKYKEFRKNDRDDIGQIWLTRKKEYERLLRSFTG